MTMFWERFCKVCEMNGKAPTSVLREIGLSPGGATLWKDGTPPRMVTIRRIADYFGVNPDYFTNENSALECKAAAKESDIKTALTDLRDCDRVMLDLSKSMTPEQVFCLAQFARSMKGE